MYIFNLSTTASSLPKPVLWLSTVAVSSIGGTALYYCCCSEGALFFRGCTIFSLFAYTNRKTLEMYMSRNDRKRTFGKVRPAKIQIRLRICAVWSESSLCAFWIAKDAKFLHADNEDSDQTARMRRLIWVFVGRTCQKVPLLALKLIYVE